MADIRNAAPMVYDEGTRDLSARQVPQDTLNIPQHLPKFYLFSEKGPVGDYYFDFSQVSLTQIYGDRSFDVNDKYYTHQTPFVNATAGAGNNCVIHRLTAPDAKDVANLGLYLDVLEVQVPLYVKNDDGSLKLDQDGEPTPVLDGEGAPITVPGNKVAWVVDNVTVPTGEYQRGALIQRPGLQTEGVKQSTQYPIFEFAAKDIGEAGNRLGVSLRAAQKSDLLPFPSNMLSEGKQFPYYFSMVRLADQITGKTEPILNSFGSQDVRFVSKPRGTDPASGAIVDLDKVTKDMYIDVPVAQASGLGTAYVYAESLATVLEKFYTTEKNLADEHRDAEINNSEDNLHALNIINFVSSSGSPYQSIKLVDFTGSTRLTRNTKLFFRGAADGAVSEDLMDLLVAADFERYNNSLHEYNDLVLHPESIIYDSGFGLDTKKAFPKFISRRKDTFVVLSTFSHKEASATLDQQYSVGVALKTMLELYPESATFGTGVMRGVIIGGAGDLINSLYAKRVPLTYELIYKAARYMGAGNGAWTNGANFSRAPGSVITQLKNFDVTWVPASTRSTLWSVGLNFPLTYGIRQAFFPAIQTVYENDTSVLNSFFTAVAISYLNKIEHAAWREFSGATDLTEAQLEERVNEFVIEKVKDKFDGQFVIVPDCQVTNLDSIRGYSWTLNIDIYANNMKTVMTAMVSARRMSDLAQ